MNCEYYVVDCQLIRVQCTRIPRSNNIVLWREYRTTLRLSVGATSTISHMYSQCRYPPSGETNHPRRNYCEEFLFSSSTPLSAAHSL